LLSVHLLAEQIDLPSTDSLLGKSGRRTLKVGRHMPDFLHERWNSKECDAGDCGQDQQKGENGDREARQPESPADEIDAGCADIAYHSGKDERQKNKLQLVNRNRGSSQDE
jgi:hypothetical protein